MSNQKKTPTVLDWESARIDQVEKSERRAWKIAGAFGVCFGLSVVAIVLMMPLKQTLPYVIRVNDTTGEINAMTAVKGKNVTFDEIQDKYWAASYVRARETYDWHTIENDYTLTRELSETPVFNSFADLYKGNNAPTKVYSNKRRINVKISSITLSGGDNKVATIRLSKSLIDDSSNAVLSKSNWIATVAYQYDPKYIASEKSRMLNPFGFRVVSYRIDPEVNNINMTPAGN
ncbi:MULTISPECIES: virB8 family protein [Snodgrassella]|uniref:virB8 family protein n=1 Tax=Snodgrassella TaxID=1193515 RepID=UPI0008154FC6|nr:MULTISPECIES: type IV secretion system protein [Snodgrassella]MCO6521230.1 type IV secretion system protein [Snodgrassella sp.]SCC04386.1 type IV secretion system protein VirB8 [Snodgrassella sp. R-53583]